MSFLEINKNILLKHYPGLFEELTAKDENDLFPEDIKIETAPTGDAALNVKGMYVHSRRDPKREGQRVAEAAIAEAANSPLPPVIILGFGLGYAALAAASAAEASGRPIIIVEKYKSLILKALELVDFSDFLSNNQIIFVIGGSGEGIINALVIISSKYGGKKPTPLVIRNKALVTLDEQWYKPVEDKIRTWTMRDEVNMATHKRFGKRWVRNLLRNMDAIRDYPGISRLAGLASENFNVNSTTNQHEQNEEEVKSLPRSFTEGEEDIVPKTPCNSVVKNVEEQFLPVFLAAAGPSLDKIKPMLRDIYDRCIIVAVDTSLRFFVKNGIQPDFVLVVDPQFWNSRHLDRCVCEKTRLATALVAESAVYPPVLNLPFKNIFLCGSLFPLGVFIENQVDPKGRLGAGGSVATTAWDFARILGTDEIWITGLDLSFPDLKTHFKGARFEESFNSQSCRFNPIEKWIVRALRDGKPFKARSGNGGQVLTDQRLSLYAAWFENQFRENSHSPVRSYNLFQDGLAIAGILNGDIDKFLTLPLLRDEINRRKSTVFSQTETGFNSPLEKNERAKRYESAVSVLKYGLISIKIAAKEGIEIVQGAQKSPLNPSQQNKVLKELDDVMRRITESEVKDVAGFLFPPMEEEKDEEDPFCAYLKSTFRFFSGIIDASDLKSI
jgi:hypothetical protein